MTMNSGLWTRSKKKYGVAICNYRDDGTLSLDVGETVHIFEEYGSGATAWYRGVSLKNKDKMGIFPACYICVKPCDFQNEGLYETIIPKEDVMVREVAYVIHEWNAIWKELYVKNSLLFEKIKCSMEELVQLRGHLVDINLTLEDAKDIKQDIVSVIDWGNGQMDLDLVPRIDGEQVDADECSLTQLYRVHADSSKIALENKPVRKRRKTARQGEVAEEAGLTTHHLLVNFRNFGCNVGDRTETLLSLHQYKDNKLTCLTEKFLVRHTKLMVPEDMDKIQNYEGLFTDLTTEEIEKDLYLVAHIYRIGCMKQDKKAQKMGFRRPWGVGVTAVNLARLPSNFKDYEYQMRVNIEGSEEQFASQHEQIIKRLIQTPGNQLIDNKGKQLPTLTMSLKILHGDLMANKKEDPMLFSKGMAQIQKMGFTEDLTPGEVRNDLYVTLKCAEFERGSKKTGKNVEVKVTVLNEAGKLIENCITYGCGEPAVSEYHSSVQYHNNRPEWNETIRISIPIDIFPGSHLCFEIFHCSVSGNESREPYGFAFVQVTNEAQIVIKDDTHDLCVFKWDGRKPLNKQQYFNLPFLVNDLNDPQKIPHLSKKHTFKANERESLSISTLLCSGKFTQNGDLLGILNWKGPQFSGKLEENLEKLIKMQGDEIVKFLHDIMDALFDMLTDDTKAKHYSNKIFKCMVNIFTLIHHARFQTFKPVLENYITDSFSATLVHQPLCECFAELITTSCSKDLKRTNLQLIESFQVMDYIFRFVVQSRKLQRKDVYSRGSGDAAEFRDNIHKVFKCMGILMSSSSDKLKAYQVNLLHSLHLVYVPLLEELSDKDMAEFLKLTLESMPDIREVPEDITRAKIELLQKTIATKLFCSDDSRALLLPFCLETVKKSFKEKTLMRPATDLLADVMDCIFKMKQAYESIRLIDVGTISIKEDIQHIIQAIFDVVMETILHFKDQFTTKSRRKISDSSSNRSTVSLLEWMKSRSNTKDPETEICEEKKSRLSYDESMERRGPRKSDVSDVSVTIEEPVQCGTMIACLMEMLRLMEEDHYEALLHVYHRGSELRTFLIHILEVFRVLVQPKVFPPDWTVMRMVTNKVVFTSMEYFSKALKDNFLTGDRFDKSVWLSYFQLAVSFITQPSLQLDRYTDVKAQKLRDRYQDMRVLMGVQVETLWHLLDVHKEPFIPQLIGPFLELTLVPEEDVRKVTLPVIFDMMKWEQRNHGDFKKVKATLIERLDYFLTQKHKGDVHYKDMFKEILLDRVQSEPSLQENGTQFIISVTHLLERLLDYRQVVDGDENRDKRMHCTFNILNFYKDEINREEMYIRYVNKLHDLHMAAGNHAEAGLTLQLYARILSWSDKMLRDEMRYKEERERDRKEMLYTQIIICFDKGKVWEYALPLCKDLAQYYEKNLDYRKLGDILKQQASFYQKILEGVPGEEQGEPDTFFPRQDPSYYRVSYYGQTFPAFVRNKQFIYRGDECLKLATIMNHLTAEFPTAQIMSHNDPPSEEVKNGDQQYIQICSVKPIPSERVEFNNKEVPVEIRNFYNFNEVDTFQFDRPYHRSKKDSSNESKTLCIERSKMRTTYKFPGILRWYEITSVELEMLCPIRVAIDQLKQNNSDLQILITRCQHNPKLFFSQLEMKLNGNIAASVQGGIAKYQEAFFTKEFETQHPDEVLYLETMKFLLHEQVKLLQTAMQIHGRLVPDELRPLHDNLEIEFKKMKKTVSQHGTPHSSMVSLNSNISGRFSNSYQEEESPAAVHVEDLPFNLAAQDKSRRSYVPFPEEGSNNIPPPIPSRPHSMLLSSHGNVQMSPDLQTKRVNTGSDPSLQATNAGSLRSPGATQSPKVGVNRRETFTTLVTRPPDLPTPRRPSETDQYSMDQALPTSPNIAIHLANGGPPPELPQKIGQKRDTYSHGLSKSSHANKPVPPLPARRGSDFNQSPSPTVKDQDSPVRPSKLFQGSHSHTPEKAPPPIVPRRSDKKLPAHTPTSRISESPDEHSTNF